VGRVSLKRRLARIEGILGAPGSPREALAEARAQLRGKSPEELRVLYEELVSKPLPAEARAQFENLSPEEREALYLRLIR
jgi:hypothetical protein